MNYLTIQVRKIKQTDVSIQDFILDKLNTFYQIKGTHLNLHQLKSAKTQKLKDYLKKKAISRIS